MPLSSKVCVVTGASSGIGRRTALELAVHNQFGADFGGFWLLSPQITQLRRLPEYYSPDEAPQVEFAIEAYLAAQIREFKF